MTTASPRHSPGSHHRLEQTPATREQFGVLGLCCSYRRKIGRLEHDPTTGSQTLINLMNRRHSILLVLHDRPRVDEIEHVLRERIMTQPMLTYLDRRTGQAIEKAGLQVRHQYSTGWTHAPGQPFGDGATTTP